MFEDAKFGDLFRTRDGRKAVFLGVFETVIWSKWVEFYRCFIEGEEMDDFYHYNEDGTNFEQTPTMLDDGTVQPFDSDIISRWNEPIDEDKLNRLADESSELYGKYTYRSMNYESERADIKISGYFDGYKDGYRKAKEE